MESNIKNMDGYLVILVSLLILIGPKTVNICKVTLEIMKSFIVSELSILRQLKEQDVIKKSRFVKNNCFLALHTFVTYCGLICRVNKPSGEICGVFSSASIPSTGKSTGWVVS